MSVPQPLMTPGTILAGRWQIQDFIGSGETGEVYGVRDMHSTGTFALKLLWPNALGQPELGPRCNKPRARPLDSV